MTDEPIPSIDPPPRHCIVCGERAAIGFGSPGSPQTAEAWYCAQHRHEGERAWATRSDALLARWVGSLLFTVVFLGLLAAFAQWAFGPQFPAPTKAQEDARQATWQAEETARRARVEADIRDSQRASERKKALCEQRRLCSKYGAARQACATAGSYQTCMVIKMGKDVGPYQCMDDGTISPQPDDMPSAFDCFLASFGN
jgi:hypothetical protein